MWKKIFRKSHVLNYRKKFKCPACNKYALYVIHDKACKCAQGCNTRDFDIDQIMGKNDFDGYFTSKELEESFYTNDDLCNSLLKKVTVNNTFDLFSEDERQKIELFFERTSKIDDKLDDIVVNYLNYNNLKNVQLITPFGYIINLIEDIHFFINLCCKDVVLFNYGIKFASKCFYSGRFFYNNAVEHLFQALERIYVMLGIFFGFKFDIDLASNKTYKIEKFLKKNHRYKNSCYKVTFERLKGNNFYNELKEIRNSNTHGLSYFTKVIDNDIKSKGAKGFELWNRDGDKVDQDLYLPRIKNIIFCLNEFFNILDYIILQIDNDKNLYKLKPFPMFDKFTNLDDNITFNTYYHNDFIKIEENKRKLFKNLPVYTNHLINDIFFRIDEVVHCIFDIYKLSEDNFYSYWRANGLELSDLIDEQYLLYSALLRIYSCFDKFACYISQRKRKYSDIRYFEEFRSITEGDLLLNKIKHVLNNENYNLLFKLRNDIYHNLRVGCLYGQQGLNYYNMVLFQTIFENTMTLFKLVDFINPNKIKVRRNDPCPCGSGKNLKNAVIQFWSRTAIIKLLKFLVELTVKSRLTPIVSNYIKPTKHIP